LANPTIHAANNDANASFGSIPPGSVSHSCPSPGNEREIVCQVICKCNNIPAGPSGVKAKQWCVSQTLWAMDKAAGNCSTIKAEVPYDMSQEPPAPYMSGNDPSRATRGRPGGSRIPDVVVVNDGAQPPVQSNIREIYEIKFPGDTYSTGQQRDYEKIAGTAPVEVLSPEDCGCGQEQPEPKPVPVPAPAPQPEEQKPSNWWKAGLVGLGLAAGLLLAPEVELPALAVGALAF
jgi:hypothetical protein